MSLKFYDNYLKNLAQTPNERWRDGLQASIHNLYENTTLKTIVMEESQDFDFSKFEEIECWVGTVADVTTNTDKNVDDYRNLYFEDVKHNSRRGTYYQFDDNYWIVYEDTNTLEAISSLKVVRCNNWLKWIDENGNLKAYPCNLGYDLMSPHAQISKKITVANGHVTVMVQGNPDTIGLVKNKRFIFNGVPYRYIAINNYMQNDYVTKDTPILFFEMYLDTIQENDNLEDNIADDTRNNYAIIINADDSLQLSKGAKGTFTATVKNQNMVMDNVALKWQSSDESLVTIDENGNYEVIGDNGDVNITVSMADKESVQDTVNITIVTTQTESKRLIIVPPLDELPLYEEQKINAYVYNNETQTDEKVECVASGLTADYYELTNDSDNEWTLINMKQSKTPLTLTFTSESGLSVVLNVKLKALY